MPSKDNTSVMALNQSGLNEDAILMAILDPESLPTSILKIHTKRSTLSLIMYMQA